MDYESKILIDRLISTLDKTDWWIVGITALNVIVVGLFSWLLWWTNKKQGERQIQIQNQQLNLSLRAEYMDLHKMLLEINEYPNSMWMNIIFSLGLDKIEYLQEYSNNTKDLTFKLKDYETYASTLLNNKEMEQYNKLLWAIGQFAIQFGTLIELIKKDNDIICLKREYFKKMPNEKQLTILNEIFNDTLKKERSFVKDSVLYLVKIINENQLYKITDKICNISIVNGNQ